MGAEALKQKSDLNEMFSRVKLLAMDVDGVLTDGGCYIFEDGRECRKFNIKDGQGIRSLMDAGISTAIISATKIESIVYRAKHLGIEEVHINVKNKRAKLIEVVDRLNLSMDEVAYMGDDLADLSALEIAGLPVTPADAVIEASNLARYVASRRGGEGAVREVCDLILKARVVPNV